MDATDAAEPSPGDVDDLSGTPVGVWHAPEGVASTPIVVHGHPGTAIPGEIEWTEQQVTVRHCSGSRNGVAVEPLRHPSHVTAVGGSP
jgi:hypothetical protein